MNWLEKTALSDKDRIENNIQRLSDLKDKVHDLGYFVTSSHSGGYFVLEDLLKTQIVKGREQVRDKLNEALTGENNQKIALDAPNRFEAIMREAEQIIEYEIGKEKRELKGLSNAH